MKALVAAMLLLLFVEAQCDVMDVLRFPGQAAGGNGLCPAGSHHAALLRLGGLSLCFLFFSVCVAGPGAADMFRAYRDMREANWQNSDKYFHARGNHDAAQRGAGGRWAAEVIR